jgi:hypothetical protein
MQTLLPTLSMQSCPHRNLRPCNLAGGSVSTRPELRGGGQAVGDGSAGTEDDDQEEEEDMEMAVVHVDCDAGNDDEVQLSLISALINDRHGKKWRWAGIHE